MRCCQARRSSIKVLPITCHLSCVAPTARALNAERRWGQAHTAARPARADSVNLPAHAASRCARSRRTGLGRAAAPLPQPISADFLGRCAAFGVDGAARVLTAGNAMWLRNLSLPRAGWIVLFSTAWAVRPVVSSAPAQGSGGALPRVVSAPASEARARVMFSGRGGQARVGGETRLVLSVFRA